MKDVAIQHLKNALVGFVIGFGFMPIVYAIAYTIASAKGMSFDIIKVGDVVDEEFVALFQKLGEDMDSCLHYGLAGAVIYVAVRQIQKITKIEPLSN